MSDYLTNLIDRNQEGRLAVKPRLNSLFEPVHPFISSSETEPVPEPSDSIAPAHSEKVSMRDSDGAKLLTPSRASIQTRFDENSLVKMVEASQPTDDSGVPSTIRPAREERERLAARISEPAEPSPPVAATSALTLPKAPLVPREIESSAMDKTFGREKPNQGRTDSPQKKTQIIATVVSQLVPQQEIKESSNPSGLVEPNLAKPVDQVRDQEEGTKTPSIAKSELSPPAVSPTVRNIKSVRAELVIESQPSQAQPIMPASASKPTTRAAESAFPIIPRVMASAPIMPESIHAEASEPVINVTIGRVEVRAAPAVTAAPGSPDSRKDAKLMSLDDYLRQRAQGGRR